jgi:predicted PurR-regulated permease PerM
MGAIQRHWRSGTSRGGFRAVQGLLLLAIGALLYVGHEAFVPVALAMLLALILSGPVEALHARRVPRSLSALLIMFAVLGALAGTLNFISVPAQQWFAGAPQTLKVIKQKVRPLSKLMNRIDEIRDSAGNMGGPAKAAAAAPAPAAQTSAPMVIFESTRVALVSAMTVIILTTFLLAGGPPMLARMASAVAGDLNAAHATDVIEKLRREVGRFYLTTALINIGLGCATAALMALCGMPNPLLWGTVAALLNFIPYAGSATTLLLLTSVAIVSFDSLGQVLAVAGSYLALATLEGQVVQPLLVGRRLALNPVLVFLALWFAGFFWGIAGIILATPALVAMKVMAENSQRGKPLLDFLSPDSRG